MTDVIVKDGKPCCPSCGSSDFMHAYDISHRGRLEVSTEGELYGTGHISEECHSWRVVCMDCNWAEYDTDIEDGEEVES